MYYITYGGRTNNINNYFHNNIMEISNLVSNHLYIDNNLFFITCQYLFEYIGGFLIIEIINDKLNIHVYGNKDIQISDNCRALDMNNNTYFNQLSYYNDSLFNFYDKMRIVKNIKNLLIIHNFGDFPVIRIDNFHPKHLWKKNIYINKPKNLLDIFSFCKNNDYMDQLLPSPDLMNFLLKQYPENFCTDWSKKINKLIFRGTNTSGYLKNDSPRKILFETSHNYPDIIDAKIINSFNYPLLLDNIDNLQYSEIIDSEPDSYKSPSDQSLYKFQIHIDGFVSAWRLVTLLFMKSLIFRVSSEWYEYYYKDLKPWVHYIPIKRDLSDLVDKINWCIINDNISKKIAENGYKFAVDNFTLNNVMDYTFRKLNNYLI